MTQKDVVAGLEMFSNCFGAHRLASFSCAPCEEGFEVLMHFRGVRRFALCAHENDAEVIVAALNHRGKTA